MYPRIKRPRPNSHLSPPPTAEVNNTCTCTFTPTYQSTTYCLIKHGDNLNVISFPSILLLSKTFQNHVVALCTIMFVSENSTFCPQMYLCILHLYHKKQWLFPITILTYFHNRNGQCLQRGTS